MFVRFKRFKDYLEVMLLVGMPWIDAPTPIVLTVGDQALWQDWVDRAVKVHQTLRNFEKERRVPVTKLQRHLVEAETSKPEH